MSKPSAAEERLMKVTEPYQGIEVKSKYTTIPTRYLDRLVNICNEIKGNDLMASSDF